MFKLRIGTKRMKINFKCFLFCILGCFSILAFLIIIDFLTVTDLPIRENRFMNEASWSTVHLDYEKKAKKLAVFSNKIHQRPTEKILFCTFMKWENQSINLLIQNIQASYELGDWLIIVYNTNGYRIRDMQSVLIQKLSIQNQLQGILGKHPFKVVEAPTKRSALDYYQEIYIRFMNSQFGFYQIKPDLLYEVDEHYRPVFFDERLHSKVSLFMLILNYLPHYKYVWTMDSDIDISELPLYRFFTAFFCSFGQPPLVSQPLIYESTQGYRYLMRDYWKYSRALASGVGFIEIQAPIFDSLFLQYFIIAFIRPLLPAMIVLGADWGIDELFCTAAREFARYQAGRGSLITISSKSRPPCMVILGNLSVHHRNRREIAHAIGKAEKININLHLMKIVREHFPHFAHHGKQYLVNPFNLGTFFPRVYQLQRNCSLQKYLY